MSRMVPKWEVCILLSLSTASIDRYVLDGKLPKPYRVGNFRVAFHSDELEECFHALLGRPLTIPPLPLPKPKKNPSEAAAA